MLSSEKTTTPETTTIQATSEETRVTDTITSEVTTIITDSFEDLYGKTTGTLDFIWWINYLVLSGLSCSISENLLKNI